MFFSKLLSMIVRNSLTKDAYKLILLFFISLAFNNQTLAAGSGYASSNPPDFSVFPPKLNCLEQWYTITWVSTADNATLFVPTVQVHYDSMTACIGFAGNITLGTSGNNCGYIGAYRYCARMAGEDEDYNHFACSTFGSSCTYGGTYNCSVQHDGASNATDYDKDYDCWGYYDCSCPGCRDICAMRVCVYLDPSQTYGVNETDDNDENFMPYHESVVADGKSATGKTVYFNTEVDKIGDDASDSGSAAFTDTSHNNGAVGCVDIPIGPYPPPYCDPIIGSVPVGNTANVCQYSPEFELSETEDDAGDAGNYEQVSSVNLPCEISTNNTGGTPGNSNAFYNIFEKPLVRIYFSNPLPLCAPGYTAPTNGTQNDVCFQMQTNLTPDQIAANNQNLIPVCSSATGSSTENCITFPSGRTTGPTGSSDVFGNQYQYFRMYYNVTNSSTPTVIEPYVYYNPADYTSTPLPNQVVAGLYDSYYIDITDLGCSGSSICTKTVGMVDYTNTARDFGAFIDLGTDPYTGLPSSGSGDGTQICVDEISDANGNMPIGCFNRPMMFSPTVSPCLTPGSCFFSKSATNIAQNPRISFQVGRKFTDIDGTTVNPEPGVIGIDISSSDAPITYCIQDDNNTSGQGTTSDTTPCTVYKAKLFSAYITDDTNYSLDSDPNAVDGTVTPYKSGTQYTGGMQYANYVYCRGGTQICLTADNNPYKTVVTKVVSVSTTENGEAKTTLTPSTILTDRIIPPYPVPGSTTETYPLDNTVLYNPEVNNWTGTYTSTQVIFGYTATVNGQTSYIEGQGCTDTAGMTCCPTSDGKTCNTGQVAYPSPLLCNCTNSVGSAYECSNSQCTVAFEETVTNEDGSLLGYQYPGNYANYSAAWSGCTYNPAATISTTTNGVTKTTTEPMTQCSAANTSYNPAIQQYSVRALTSMELGLCVPILQPYCGALSTYDEPDGYASWPQTSAQDWATGTCGAGMVNSTVGTTSTSPTRQCVYQDTQDSQGNPVMQANGCPEFTQVWGPVVNPCAVAPMPEWWPGTFLYGKSKYQGAIINQFSVNYYYRAGTGSNTTFTPNSYNADPFNLYKSNSTPVSPEPWNSTYNSCKKDGAGDTSNFKRSVTNGDQEMLYLTQAQWSMLWSDNNLSWLLTSSDDSQYDGCAVYDLKGQINATYSSNVVPAMKICKHQDNISFSLVDLGKNSCSSTPCDMADGNCSNSCYGYGNTHYMMQSNIASYAAYVSANIQNDNSFNITNEISSVYDTKINHGIVISRLGFGIVSVTDASNPAIIPSVKNFAIESAESVTVKLNFDHYYEGSHQHGCTCFGSCCQTSHTTCNTYNPGITTSPQSCVTSTDMDTYTPNTSYYSTNKPLSVFSRSMNLSSAQSAVSYMFSSENINNSTLYYTPNFSSIWIARCCNDDNPEVDMCNLQVNISSYKSGNSAINTSMFYWSSPTSYNVSNPGTTSWSSTTGMPLN